MNQTAAFALMRPHLRAAYNLARWLLKNDHDADDVFQEATLRALRYIDGYDAEGSGMRTWLLAIVRNASYAWLQKNGKPEVPEQPAADPSLNPEQWLLIRASAEQVNAALQELGAELREVIVLRELEGLSYKEIAEVAHVPIGTVMSRLSRARRALQARLVDVGALPS
jgi:RNA polymerase sigma-70 factor (ECF subfamily)